jgi:hypothetical protein
MNVFDDLMDPHDREARAGLGLGLGNSLESLLTCLDSLREQFKDAVARVIGGSAAKALARLVRRLLGCHEVEGGLDWYGGASDRDDYRRWGDEDDEDYLAVPRPGASRPPTLLGGITAGLLALLSWLAPLASWAGTLIG